MVKMNKRWFLVITMMIGIIFGCSQTVSASEDQPSMDEYQMVWQQLNEKYNLDLKVGLDDLQEMSLNEFKEESEKIMVSERLTLDWIAARESGASYQELPALTRAVKTRTKRDWYDGSINIVATYNVSGSSITSASDAYATPTWMAWLAGTEVVGHNPPTYSYLDSRRTLGVRLTGGEIQYGHGAHVWGVTFYSEFYYSE